MAFERDPLWMHNANPRGEMPGLIEGTVGLGPDDGFGSVPPIVGNGPDRRLENAPEGLSGYEFNLDDAAMFACRGTRYSRVKQLGARGKAVRFPDHSKVDEAYWGPDNNLSFFEVSDVTIGTEGPASDNAVEDVWAGAFCQAVLIGRDHENNGDFTKIRDISCEDLKYGVKSEAGQSRSVMIQGFVGRDIWCVLSNIDEDGTHGQFGGHIDSMSVGSFIGRIFEFSDTPSIGPLTFTSLKAESLHRFGDWLGNTSSEGSLLVNKGNLNFLGRKEHGWDVPSNLMGGNCQASITLNGVEFSGTPVVSMMPEDVRLQQGCKLNTTLTIKDDWQKAAWNATLGIYCGQTQHDVKTTIYGDADAHNVSTGEYRHSHVTIPAWVERARFPDHPVEILHQRPVWEKPASEFEIVADGLNLAITRSAQTPNRIVSREIGWGPGGVMRNSVTGQVLWINNVDGNQLQAVAISGHDHVEVTADMSVGKWEFTAPGYKSPTAPLWGKFTAGSEVIEFVGSTDGLKAGDMIAVSQHARGDFGPAPFIKEVDGNWVLEAPAGETFEAPLFVWIEDTSMMGLDLSVGVGSGTSTAEAEYGFDEFTSGVDGWAGSAGSPTVSQVANDNASHNPGGYTGCLKIDTSGGGTDVVSKSFTVPRSKKIRVEYAYSFGASGDRFSRGFSNGGGGGVTSAIIAGGTTSPLTNPNVSIFEMTTGGTANDETLTVEIKDFGPTSDTYFLDYVRVYEA